MKTVLILAAIAAGCSAQTSTLRVVSEFTRIDPFGNIAPQDRGKAEPREFLSPGIPRNAYSSLRLVVTLDKPTKYTLDVGQNPENAVRATLYREKFVKHGEQWIADGLEPVRIPYEGEFPTHEIPGQTTMTFWLDLWVDRNAPVDRIKVEPQLWVSAVSEWFTYPMEARVLEAVLPSAPSGSAVLPAITERSDASALGPLRARFCEAKEQPGPSIPGVRDLIRRNALILLGAKDVQWESKLLAASGAATVAQWCSAKVGPAFGPEWYLKLRDSVLRARQDSQ